MSLWKPREIKDAGIGKKIPKGKVCPKHGAYYGKFCLKCQMEKVSVRPKGMDH